ncbi:hypothetical protein [Pectobacterium phage PEAT2]|uniref:Uncharacterized protein n=1 Tax=Pectobacterium phage PEAT2 TaxID=2053078 RepID=A0A2H4N7B4_9CAUD|nr:hypothetical protein F8206_gp43 [Pectobacterium phage PEAT2]ATV25081.1 hypothetical protein [Pectobacterium phage PEAT2]
MLALLRNSPLTYAESAEPGLRFNVTRRPGLIRSRRIALPPRPRRNAVDASIGSSVYGGSDSPNEVMMRPLIVMTVLLVEKFSNDIGHSPLINVNCNVTNSDATSFEHAHVNRCRLTRRAVRIGQVENIRRFGQHFEAISVRFQTGIRTGVIARAEITVTDVLFADTFGRTDERFLTDWGLRELGGLVNDGVVQFHAQRVHKRVQIDDIGNRLTVGTVRPRLQPATAVSATLQVEHAVECATFGDHRVLFGIGQVFGSNTRRFLKLSVNSAVVSAVID